MPTKTAIQFVFKADQMKSICKDGKDILITSYIEEVTTKGDQKVGALRVKAKSISPKEDITAKVASLGEDGTVYGCPIPPCNEED